MSNAVAILTMDSINALESKELKQELKTYLKAGEGISKSRWEMARAIYNVVNGELFDDDFENDGEFYNYIGLKKSNASQLVNAVRCAEQHNLETSLISVGKAYALSTLTDEEFDDFEAYLGEQEIDITVLSDKALVQLIKEWRVSQLTVIEEEVEESAEPLEEVEEPVEDKESIILHIILTMQENGITVDDIIEKLNN